MGTRILLLLVAAISLATSSQGNSVGPRVVPADQMKCVEMECLSWRVANEANNIVGWKEVPLNCKDYVKNYLLADQYRSDSKSVVDEAIKYLASLPLPKDGRNIWIFDIDETVLSNARYIIDHELYESQPPPPPIQPEGQLLPDSQRFYNKTLSLGIKNVFITGRGLEKKELTINNLVKVGYNHNWEMLIFKDKEFENMTAQDYKSTIRANLVKKGYRIMGNIGDQWTDLLGHNGARRSFKLPNPMYYIS